MSPESAFTGIKSCYRGEKYRSKLSLAVQPTQENLRKYTDGKANTLFMQAESKKNVLGPKQMKSVYPV